MKNKVNEQDEYINELRSEINSTSCKLQKEEKIRNFGETEIVELRRFHDLQLVELGDKVSNIQDEFEQQIKSIHESYRSKINQERANHQQEVQKMEQELSEVRKRIKELERLSKINTQREESKSRISHISGKESDVENLLYRVIDENKSIRQENQKFTKKLEKIEKLVSE